ncbi:MAG: ATP-binding cassette domain-containing protein [Planctomycetota bacterium]|nr:ATP-binding cassette domain-containing protein [Planctomycetota bacterium]
MLRGAGVDFDGRPALAGVDLEVGSGEAIAIVGPSGSGKTTLLRLLNGTVAPTHGSVAFEGTDLGMLHPRELRRVRSRVGFVHQDHSLVPNLRVSQNVIAGKLGRRGLAASTRSMLWPSREDLEHAHAILERLGLPEKLFERTDTLSGGQQQRVALARALFQDPAALIADEPVASVDPARARSLIRLMQRLAEEEGLTLVVSLHDLTLAREFFPRTVGLREGRLRFDRPTAEIAEEEFVELYRIEEDGNAV